MGFLSVYPQNLNSRVGPALAAYPLIIKQSGLETIMQKLDPKVKELLRQMDVLNRLKRERMKRNLPHHDIDTTYDHLYQSLVLVERVGSEVVQ